MTRSLVPASLMPLASDPVAPTPVAGDAYFNTTSKKVRVYDGTAWADIGGGGGGTKMLASAEYAPATEVNYSTTSTSLVVVDAANLSVTFVATTARSRLVLNAWLHQVYALGTGAWGVIDAGGTQVGPAVLVRNDSTNGARQTAIFTIPTTPGQSYTLRWGFARSTRVSINGSAIEIQASDGSPNTPGPARMEVWEA